MHLQLSPAPKQLYPRTVNKESKSNRWNNRALKIAVRRLQHQNLKSKRSCRLLTLTQGTSITKELTWISYLRKRFVLTRKLWTQAIKRTSSVRRIRTSSTILGKTSKLWGLKPKRTKPWTQTMIGMNEQRITYQIRTELGKFKRILTRSFTLFRLNFNH